MFAESHFALGQEVVELSFRGRGESQGREVAVLRVRQIEIESAKMFLLLEV